MIESIRPSNMGGQKLLKSRNPIFLFAYVFQRVTSFVNFAEEVIAMSHIKYMPWRCVACEKMRAPDCRPEFFVRQVPSASFSMLKGGYRCSYCVERALQGKVPTPYDGLYSVHEAASVLGVSGQAIRDWVRDGKLDHVVVGRKWLLTPDSVEEALGPMIDVLGCGKASSPIEE